MARGSLSFDASAQQLLETYPWPGNVRELDNIIQRALIMQDGNVITAAGLAVDATGAQNNGFGSGFAHGAGSGAGSGAGRGVDNSASLMHTAGTDAAVEMQAQEDDGFGEGVLGSDLKQREFEIILQTLRQQGGRRKETAEVLGVSARTLRYKMARMRDSGINIDTMLGVY